MTDELPARAEWDDHPVLCVMIDDLPNEHSMALTRPVQCLLHARARHIHSPDRILPPLQLSFSFLPRRHNVHQNSSSKTSSNGKFAAAKSDFSLERRVRATCV